MSPWQHEAVNDAGVAPVWRGKYLGLDEVLVNAINSKDLQQIIESGRQAMDIA